MKKTTIRGASMPTAQICINKSRLKVYNPETSPTFYLKKGQEFQIELHNPTSDTILAKIYLNGKAISQGGLVLRPAERVFLERYLDVAKKFLFDTYEVSNTEESIKAIEDNGDFRVEFFRESTPVPSYNPLLLINRPYYRSGLDYNSIYDTNTTIGGYVSSTTTNITPTNLNLTNTNTVSLDGLYNSTSSMTSMSNDVYKKTRGIGRSEYANKSLNQKRLKSKSIETGRVEEGSQSDQQIKTVDKKFEYLAFHTISYKMLPVSQKVNTIEDINVKRYCTNCGAKQKPEFKFCPSCGKKC